MSYKYVSLNEASSLHPLLPSHTTNGNRSVPQVVKVTQIKRIRCFLPESKKEATVKVNPTESCKVAVSDLLEEHQPKSILKNQNPDVLKFVQTSKVTVPNGNCSVKEVKSNNAGDLVAFNSKIDHLKDSSKSLNQVDDASSAAIIMSVEDSQVAVENNEKVVVQVVSNIGCRKISALEHCIDVSDIPCEIDESKQIVGDESNNDGEVYSEISKSPGTVTENRLGGKLWRNHSMNLHIRPGNGVKLLDIPHIVTLINEAEFPLLTCLHRVMYGTFKAICKTDVLSQTRQNILHFSGFPFKEDSESFQVKKKCLHKIPYPLLNSMCKVLLEKSPRTRQHSVEDLLRFFMKPTISEKSIEDGQGNSEEEYYSDNELSRLADDAMKRPLPIILVKKLQDDFVKAIIDSKSSVSLSPSKPNYKGNMEKTDRKQRCKKVSRKQKVPTQLKAFPEIVLRVQKARRRIINIMHIFLYGRPGSEDINRKNILEFQGFNNFGEATIRRKIEFLLKLRLEELNQLCMIFSLRVKKCSKFQKATKFLSCLLEPEIIKRSIKKENTEARQHKESASKKHISYNEESSCIRNREKVIAKKGVPYSVRKIENDNYLKKLKDFEKIRKNVECAPPEELTGLSDLLFLVPLDSLEIHQKILNFSSSSFQENSPDFHTRNTLLYYMSFDVIKKIASFLEITDWQHYTSSRDLAKIVLRFLMDMKVSESIYSEKHSNDWHPPPLDSEDAPVVVRRITESSSSFTGLKKNNEPITVSDSKSEESHSLYQLVQHPSEKQLEVTVREIVCAHSWSSTVGEIINKVFQRFPEIDLTYQTNFIKRRMIEILHELQDGAKPFGDIMS